MAGSATRGTSGPGRRRSEWTTWSDVRDQLRRRWDRGDSLSAHAAGLPFEPLDLPIRGPGPRDIGDRFDDVRAWRTGWTAAPRGARVVEASIGGRLIGVNRLPSRVAIDSWDELISVLGVWRDVDTFDARLASARDLAPALVEWMTRSPMRVLAAGEDWDRLVTTVLWIDQQARPGSYLREIDVPGVDTKFVETHRGLLADLLESQLAPARIDATRPRSDFAGRFGFRSKPDHLRLRLPPEHAGPFSEIAVRVEELAHAPVGADTVIVVENEITYLALPPRPRTAVLLGGGYAARRLTPLTWLADVDLRYWGDIDTHGLAILDRLRAAFPHTRSILMDQATLLAHRTQWVQEPSPTAERLDRLTPEESALYAALVTDAFGPSVRLEQERVRMSLAERALRVD
ncbi:DUF3322 domain-containing protein [Blastococcus saxobsidens]|uniref:DUF3322 and DUF2220 domain-containing protein n=1 Tax=Blastococcus saxobsidens (strain DD2) TaxID=1146883 RepID=H6RTY3_BLASD|nr:DUF3322 domain-containing protein [Blastococcus saxobsidens]CCG04393.1 conserved protein of unknown function [Blastococcus saxobsidens DD2]